MTPGDIENVTIEFNILKNPYLYPKVMYLALLELILSQDSS